MSEARNCEDCGEWDDGHDNHVCKGPLGPRCDRLEEEVAALRERLETLLHDHFGETL